MANNSNLRKADKVEFDEYYTQYEYIQKEINAFLEYNPETFRDKTILLPCDDPEWSNFTKFFAQNFDKLKLQKLISTSYSRKSKLNKYKNKYKEISSYEVNSPSYDAAKSEECGRILILERNLDNSKKNDIDDIRWRYLEGDGDFRSDEITRLRDESDIIITNPPFSLIREFISWLLEGNKQFLIIGRETLITYKEVFPLIKNLNIWTGATSNSSDMVFEVPKGTKIAESDKLKAAKLGYVGDFTRLGNSCWFTNIDHGRRHQILELMTYKDNIKFSRHKEIKNHGYDKFDSYDAINVPYTDAIPSDYEGLMGVPISFIHKLNPTQFEIIDGIGRYSVMNNEESKKTKKYLSMIDGKAKFFRVIIRKKKLN